MVTREDKIEQSVSDHVRTGLESRGYIPDIVDLRESFPSMEERATEMTKTQVAIGFNFDDGGRLIELGSDLTERTYTIELWTFGLDRGEGRNVAHVIKAVIEATGGVPLKDVAAEGQPTIDFLMLPESRAVAVTRQLANDPRPWDMFVYTTTVKLIDQYYPSMEA